MKRARGAWVAVAIVICLVTIPAVVFFGPSLDVVLPFLLLAVLASPALLVRGYPQFAWGALFLEMSANSVVSFLVRPDHQTFGAVPTAILIAYPIVMYAVALRYRRAVVAGAWLIGLLPGLADFLTSGSANQPLLLALLSAIAVVAGDNVRGRREARDRLLDEERHSAELRNRRTLLEERARIARELHDVVAHHMSLITVQASTVGYRNPGLSREAEEEFDSIGATARAALTELRRLLNLLRSEDDAAERAPQPGLSEVEDLIRTTRSAGIEVTLRQVDLPERLPDAVGLSAFRILQEALSNVARHAPGATAEAELRGEPGRLMLEVLNDGPADPSESDTLTEGHGILGMRERAQALGGALWAAPMRGGGFRVAAVLPTDSTAEAADAAESTREPTESTSVPTAAAALPTAEAGST